MSIILALSAAVFAAFTSILAKIGIENINSNLATAVRTLVVLAMAALVVLVTGQIGEVTEVGGSALIYLVLSGITTGLSWLCYFKAIQIGDVSKVVPIDKSSIVMTIILSFFILGEPVNWLVVTGGGLITTGTFLLIGRNKAGQKTKFTDSYVWLAILSAFFAAVTAILAKFGLEDVDSNVATFIRTVVILVFAWFVVFFTGAYKGISNIGKKTYLFLVLSGIATGLSWLCYFAAISIGRVSIVAPIDKFSVVITMVLSFIILKEIPSKSTILGGVVIMAGTIILII
ncbi:MAG: EamA family transporter [Bacillus sp. (in: firmicutes)]